MLFLPPTHVVVRWRNWNVRLIILAHVIGLAGHRDKVKRVYRIYREQGLSLRLKRPRRNKAAKLRLMPIVWHRCPLSPCKATPEEY